MTALNKQARQVQRYTNYGVDMMEWADGGYVRHSDYLALLDELEAAEKRNAELEARTVTLPVTGDVHPLAPYEAKIFCEFKKNIVQECADAIRAAGIGVKGE